MPERVWRAITRPAAGVLRILPVNLTYGIGLRLRRGRMPYSVIRPDDVVVQIGAPKDLLEVGRSRAGYFLHLVSGTGRVIVIEPDRVNCTALEEFARSRGLADRLIVLPVGAWSSDSVLGFYESKLHPASAVLVDLSTAAPEEMERRGYREVRIPVKTVDQIVAELGLPAPRLVSITTNGAELEILKGMKATLEASPDVVLSLAMTGAEFDAWLQDNGFRQIAIDDRGFTFERTGQTAA